MDIPLLQKVTFQSFLLTITDWKTKWYGGYFMKDMIVNIINKLTGWRDHPESIFITAAPLATLAFACVFATAYLQHKVNGDTVYTYILIGGLVLLALGLYPVYKMHKNLKRLNNIGNKKGIDK